jgi:hypothetical protein
MTHGNLVAVYFSHLALIFASGAGVWGELPFPGFPE